MIALHSNKNAFLSLMQSLENDIDAFCSMGIAKGIRTHKKKKKRLSETIADTLDHIDTHQHGIRIILITTKE